MAGRTTDDVKRELEAERERLGDAVKKLRSQAGTVRRRLPFLALGAAGAGLALRTAARRVARKRASGSEKRSRFGFLDRD